MVDVTEARNNERQLLQNNKMIAVGQLAAGVAHEIRNPLGLIRNYCYVLKETDYSDYINRDEAIAVIERSVEKSSRIIDNLLNFSRLSTDKKELVNLQAHINANLELQRSLLIQRKIDVSYEYTGDYMAFINVEAIEIILINLITNAVDAIAGRGEIKVFCSQDDQSVQLVVSDNGRGIPPEVMDEIYNPFFTTKKKREGNGLGLYIVYNEVQKMGGEIKAESEVGKGTTFYIKIPSENGRGQDEQKRIKNPGGDDEPDYCNVMKVILTAKGHLTDCTVSGAGALELMSQSSYDLVITDLMMPEMDGRQLLQEIKTQYPGTEVIMLTAYGSIENAVEAMRDGAYSYVTKGGNPEETDP